MPTINIPDDCGNSPKKLFLKDFNIAFIKNDLAKILESLTDDVRWNMVGSKVVEGKEAIKEFILPMMESKGTELTINSIITHGKTAAVDGVMAFEDGSRIAFCDIYTFSGHDDNAKIKEMTSYIVELK